MLQYLHYNYKKDKKMDKNTIRVSDKTLELLRRKKQHNQLASYSAVIDKMAAGEIR